MSKGASYTAHFKFHLVVALDTDKVFSFFCRIFREVIIDKPEAREVSLSHTVVFGSRPPTVPSNKAGFARAPVSEYEDLPGPVRSGFRESGNCKHEL